jgi:hypothetical protein
MQATREELSMTTSRLIRADRIGFDFNPTVDKIRVTSDADDNLRLDPDPGSLLAKTRASRRLT